MHKPQTGAQDGFTDKSSSLHTRTTMVGHSCLGQPLLICLIYDSGGVPRWHRPQLIAESRRNVRAFSCFCTLSPLTRLQHNWSSSISHHIKKFHHGNSGRGHWDADWHVVHAQCRRFKRQGIQIGNHLSLCCVSRLSSPQPTHRD